MTIALVSPKASSELSHEGLIELLKYDIGHKAYMVVNKMKGVLITPQLRWEFVERFDNRSYREGAFNILCKMRREILDNQSEQAIVDFLHNFRFDPIKAINEYLVDNVTEFIYEELLINGLTPERLVEIKRQKNEVTPIEVFRFLHRVKEVKQNG